MDPTFGDRKPDIDYPCPWTYTLIGGDEARMRQSIAGVVADRTHSLSVSNRSRSGRYVSLTLEITVRSEEERQATFEALCRVETVRYVI